MFIRYLNTVLLENPQDWPRFVCMMLHGKMLQPGMIPIKSK